MNCRAFEDRLAADLDALLGAPEGTVPELSHASECPACGNLLSRLRENSFLLGRLARPEPDRGFLARIAAPPGDFAARRAAAEVLALLAPGVLATPEPSPEFLARLAFLPTRARAAKAPPAKSPGLIARLLSDWRVTVALVYGVLFIVIGALKVDPLSVARGAATDLTTSGERVLAEAQTAAVRRLEGSPLTRRLDYKVYRAVAASRARASAYAQLLFEKLVGGGDETAAVSTRPKDGRPPSREPARSVLRSSVRTLFERVERT